MTDLLNLLTVTRNPKAKRAMVTLRISWDTTAEGASDTGVNILSALSKMLSEILTPEEQADLRRQLDAEVERSQKRPSAKRATSRQVARKAGGGK